jgi:hypothetical protein
VRALRFVHHLSERIGLRVAGTPGAQTAAAYVEAQLAAIPGLEIERQDTAGVEPGLRHRRGTLVYRTRNIVARLRGENESALLVSTHYDTPSDSVGAADAAAPVGALLEVVRALARDPRPRHSVIFLVNGAEEQGLLGAAGFRNHPWFSAIRAFVNVEAAGSGGKAILFQAGPGNAWLLHAYRRAAPHPHGSAIGQDLFQRGAIPSDTDFRIYREAGLRGLDIAFYRDGYAYHTALDRAERLESGSLQQMGDNLLALVRELAKGELPGDVSPERSVYYDVLGVAFVAYTETTARILAVLGAGLSAFAVFLALRLRRMRARALLWGISVSLLGLPLGLATSASLSLVPSLLLERPHRWFATPWPGIAAFALLALAGALVPHAIWRHRSERRGGSADERFHATWAGALVTWTVLLAVLTALGLGASYLAWFWVMGLALGLVAALWAPRFVWLALLAGCLPGALLTTQVAGMLLHTFVPLAGRLPLPFPFDPLFAALVAVPTVLTGAAALAQVHRVGRLGSWTLALLSLGGAALVVQTMQRPYTERHPKRVVVEHREEGDQATLLVRGLDFPDPGPLLAHLSPHRLGTDEPARYRVDAAPHGLPRAQVTTRSEGESVILRIRSTSDRFTLRIPKGSISAWSLGPALPALHPEETAYAVHVVAPPPLFEIVLRRGGPTPLVLSMRELFTTSPTSELRRARAALPSWVTVSSFASRRSVIRP